MTSLDGVLPPPRMIRDAPEPPPARHHHPLAEIEEAAEHEVHSLRELFRHRRLSVRTMDRPLRLATGGALASLLGTVLLIALRNIPSSATSVGRTSGLVTELATPLFIATLVLISIGFAYVLTGAVLASRPIALLALVVITFEIGIYAGAFGSVFGFDGFVSLLPGWARWTSRGMLIAIWLLAIAVMVIDTRSPERRTDRRLRLTVLGLYALIFGGYFTVLGIASPDIGGLNLFPQSVGLMMLDIADLTTPILLIAAVDFGEWGGLLGERVAAALAGARSRRSLLAPLSALLSVSLIAFGYAQIGTGSPWSWARGWDALRTTLILAGALLVAVLVGRALGVHRRRWPATLNFAALFAVCGVLVYLLAPVSGVLAGQFRGVTKPVEQVSENGHFTAEADVIVGRLGTGKSTPTLLIPRGWLDASKPTFGLWINGALPGAKPGTFVRGLEKVGVGTLTETADAKQFVAGTHSPLLSAQRHDGPWTVARTRIGGAEALVWLRPAPSGGSYVLEELASGVPFERVVPQLEAIAHSFRPAGQPHATLPAAEETPEDQAQHGNDLLQSFALALSAGLLVLLLGAVGLFGRRWPARLVGTILLFGMVSLFTLLYFTDSVGRILGGHDAHWPYVGQSGLLVAVGVLSLVGLAVGFRDPERRRRYAVALISLQATVWALRGMSELYDHALSASRIAVWAAIIVLVAIAWDVVMSGESMTNEGSRHVPRAARLMAFLGYVILVSATVLFYSAQRVTGTGVAAEPTFEPEAVTQNGLFRIAFPLAVLMFLLRLAGRRRQDRTTPPVPPVPLPPGAWTPPPAAPPASSAASPTR